MHYFNNTLMEAITNHYSYIRNYFRTIPNLKGKANKAPEATWPATLALAG